MKEEDFESYVIEDDEEPAGDPGKKYTMWNIVPKVMVFPNIGWPLAQKSGPAPEIAIIRFLLPISILSAVSDFISYLYPGSNNFTTTLVGAVITFCSFFLGYYLALVLSKILLPKEARDLPSSSYGKLMTIAAIGTLAFFNILMQALPMFDSILEFLPIWTVYVIYTGMKYAKIETDKTVYAIGVVCVAVICSPVIVEWILNLFI